MLDEFELRNHELVCYEALVSLKTSIGELDFVSTPSLKPPRNWIRDSIAASRQYRSARVPNGICERVKLEQRMIVAEMLVTRPRRSGK